MRDEKLVEVRVRLERDSLTKPWGFQLVGGVDFNSPVVVQKVSSGSPADNVLLKDDIMQSIDNYDVTTMTNKQVEDVLKTAGKELLLFFLRPAINQIMLEEAAATLTRDKRQKLLSQNLNFNQLAISQAQDFGTHLSAFTTTNTARSREATPSFLRSDRAASQGPFRSPSVNKNIYNSYGNHNPNSIGINYQGNNHVEVFVEPRNKKGTIYQTATLPATSYNTLRVPGQESQAGYEGNEPKQVSVSKMSACPGGTLFPHSYVRHRSPYRASSVTPSVVQRPASAMEYSRCATPEISSKKLFRPLSTSGYGYSSSNNTIQRGSQVSYLILPVRNCRVVLPQKYNTFSGYQQQSYYQPQAFSRQPPSFQNSQHEGFYATTPTFNRPTVYSTNNFRSYRPCPIVAVSSF